MNASGQTRAVGEAAVTILNAGDLQFDLAAALDLLPPEWRASEQAEFEDPVRMPVQSIVIRLPETVVLVDAPRYDLEPNSEFRIPDYEPPDGPLEQLASAGIAPEAVEHLVITHAHFDHFNGLTQVNEDGVLEPVFPNATVYLGRGDWESDEMRRALETAETLEARTFGILDPLGFLTVVDEKREITPGVEIIPSPGETPGHLSVRVESAGRTAYCVGDLYHHEMEVEQLEWAVNWADQAAIRASRSALTQAALAEDALLAATHIRGFGRLAPTPDGVRWEPA